MQTLRKIKCKNLDVEKYSKSLNASLNYRIYAESWYLDIVTDGKWECWIYGDYEVIMPVPLQFKFGLKIVIMPAFCQQLGVFYKEEIPDELFKKFEKKIHKYLVRSYCFNEENTQRYNPKGEKRVNYILDLNKPYEEILDNYKKKRRKDLNKGINLEVVKSKDTENHFKIQKQYYPNLNKLNKNINLMTLLSELKKRGLLTVYDLHHKRQLIASQIFIYSKTRIICSSFFRNKDLDNYNSSAYSKNFLIKKESGNNLILDFEGSMMAGVAEFYEGFGAEKKYYIMYHNFRFKIIQKNELTFS